jgi:hypothetical protein
MKADEVVLDCSCGCQYECEKANHERTSVYARL